MSVTDLRRSNRLPRRRHANPRRTWLWIGRTSGHRRGLFVDRIDKRENPETDANIRHDHAGAAGFACMAAFTGLYSCSDGKYGSLLETGLRRAGGRRSFRDRGSQRPTRQEGSRTQDRREGRGVDRGFALPRLAPRKLRSAEIHSGIVRPDALPAQVGGKPGRRTQSSAKAAGDCQHQARQRSYRCFRSLQAG